MACISFLFTDSASRMLQNIHDDLKREAEGKWRERLLRKNSIETALTEYHTQIDDVARSFQVSVLWVLSSSTPNAAPDSHSDSSSPCSRGPKFQGKTETWTACTPIVGRDAASCHSESCPSLYPGSCQTQLHYFKFFLWRTLSIP